MIRISGCQGASERISLSLATATFLENRNQLFYFFFDFFNRLSAACRVIPYRWAKQVAFGIFIS